jgi:signal transduction histidine kinase
MPDPASDIWLRWRLPVQALVILAIVTLPFLFLRAVTQNSLAAAALVTHSSQVQTAVRTLMYDVRDLEAAAVSRASGIDTAVIRDRALQSASDVPIALQSLTQLTRDNPSQQVRIGMLRANVEPRVALAAQIQANTSPTQLRQAVEILTTRYPIRGTAGAIMAEEQHLLASRQADAQRQGRWAINLTWIAMAAQLLLLGLITYFSQRHITRRLAAESAFSRASSRAESVLQTVREPIVLLDAEQRVVMHNAAFSELYALGNNVHGTPLTDVGDGAWGDPALLQRLNDVLMRGRELWDYEQLQVDAAGVNRTMLVNARTMPLPDSDDRVVLMTVSDISTRKTDENRIRELNRQLEGKVDQVTEINQELEAFSYSVSHDLRAPLRHIGGFAAKLGRHLGDRADEKSLHYLEIIGGSATRMSTLIDDLLVYSRLGRSALRLQAVDMQSLVVETRAMLDANAQTDMPGRRIEWQVAPLPILIADENMMRQVWLNLLGNAVKYSGTREVTRIAINHERADDGSHHFSVTDNGVGFDMEYAAKLFGVFQRMHKASEYPGTGIGLASVRRVLMRHGGRIWGESKPDVGATFHFVLPSSLDTPVPARNGISI